ncbi:MAG: macro domain-containing protein [Bacteroidia bacterium]
MVDSWNKYFHSEKNVTIMQGDLTEVTVDALVSPANSFGFMDGGVDYAISMRLGWDLQDELQKKIKEQPEGELLVGKALTIPTNDDLIPYLISAPTMRVPMSFNIATSINAYLAMKATLIEAQRHHHINEIAITGFCTGVGKMPRDIAANQMYQAFLEIEHKQKMNFETFGDAQKYHWKINTNGALWET